MATTRLMPLHAGKGRTAGIAIAAIIDYVKNPEKTDNGRLITSWQCDSRVADSEFLFSKQQYIRNIGRVRGADDVIAYHLAAILPSPARSCRRKQIVWAASWRSALQRVIMPTLSVRTLIRLTSIITSFGTPTALDEQRKFRNFWGAPERYAA